MKQKSILAISSSKVGNSGYLEKAAPIIKDHLGSEAVNIAFIPFAAADNNYSAYGDRVKEALQSLPYSLSVVTPQNATSTLEDCDAIMVGGGNTFKLLHDIYDLGILNILKQKISGGCPYVGWSAGANIIGRTIGTSNDMPIVEPKSFKALGIFPFQINPHYYNQTTEGFNGETRDQRLEEYLRVNRRARIVGLPEGTSLELKGGALRYIGQTPGMLFSINEADSINRKAIADGTDLSYLLKTT